MSQTDGVCDSCRVSESEFVSLQAANTALRTELAEAKAEVERLERKVLAITALAEQNWPSDELEWAISEWEARDAENNPSNISSTAPAQHNKGGRDGE